MNLNNSTGLWGVDYSKWQSDPIRKIYIDFDKLVAGGASFGISKIGQHNYYDYDADHNWKQAKAVGLSRGSYWFLDYRSKGKAQAQMYFDFFDKRGDLGEGVHFADFETGSGGDWHTVYDFIVEFQRLSGLPNYKIGIYSGYFYWIENSPLSIEQRNWFAQYPFWLAWYINNPPTTSLTDVYNYYSRAASNAKVPPQWKEENTILWQGGTPAFGKFLGAQSKEIDFNLVNGDAKSFEKHWGKIITVPQEPQPPQPPTNGGEDMYNLIVLAAYLNGRDAPGTAGAVVFPAGSTFSTGFRKDDVLESDLTQKDAAGVDWYRITKCTRSGANVQLPNPVWASAGATYSLMRLYTPQTPPTEPTPRPEIYLKFSPTGQSYKYVLVEE